MAHPAQADAEAKATSGTFADEMNRNFFATTFRRSDTSTPNVVVVITVVIVVDKFTVIIVLVSVDIDEICR